MKRTKFTDAEIAFVLRQAEEGTSVAVNRSGFLGGSNS